MFSSHLPPFILPCTILTVFTVLTLFTIYAIFPRVSPPSPPPAPPPFLSSSSTIAMGGTIPRHVKARSNNKKKDKKERQERERELAQNPQGNLGVYGLVSPNNTSQDGNAQGTPAVHDLDNASSSDALAPANQNVTVPVLADHSVQPHEPGDEELSPGRVFNTQLYPYWFAPADIQTQTGKWVYVSCPWGRTKCPCHKVYPYHVGRLMVSIAGVAVNSKPGARGCTALGVFYGKGNRHNIASLVEDKRHTAQSADLNACIAALHRAIMIRDAPVHRESDTLCYPFKVLIIRSHSEYLVKGATEWLPKWKSSGWKNCNGQPVANEDLWRTLDSWITHLEQDMIIQFWLVPKKENTMADGLARAVLKRWQDVQ